jgi:hypothetical protein
LERQKVWFFLCLFSYLNRKAVLPNLHRERSQRKERNFLSINITT